MLCFLMICWFHLCYEQTFVQLVVIQVSSWSYDADVNDVHYASLISSVLTLLI